MTATAQRSHALFRTGHTPHSTSGLVCSIEAVSCAQSVDAPCFFFLKKGTESSKKKRHEQIEQPKTSLTGLWPPLSDTKTEPIPMFLSLAMDPLSKMFSGFRSLKQILSYENMTNTNHPWTTFFEWRKASPSRTPIRTCTA